MLDASARLPVDLGKAVRPPHGNHRGAPALPWCHRRGRNRGPGRCEPGPRLARSTINRPGVRRIPPRHPGPFHASAPGSCRGEYRFERHPVSPHSTVRCPQACRSGCAAVAHASVHRDATGPGVPAAVLTSLLRLLLGVPEGTVVAVPVRVEEVFEAAPGAPPDKQSPCHLAGGALPLLRGADGYVRSILARGKNRRHRGARRQLVGGNRAAYHLQHVPALLHPVQEPVHRGSHRGRHLGGGALLRVGPHPRAGPRVVLPGPRDPGSGHHSVPVRRGQREPGWNLAGRATSS